MKLNFFYTLYKLILVAGIVPASVLAFIGIISLNYLVVMMFQSLDMFIVSLSLLLLLTGYVGLWRSLITETKSLINTILTFAGILGYFIIINKLDFWNNSINLRNNGYWLFFNAPFLSSLPAFLYNLHLTLKTFRIKRTNQNEI